MYEHNALGYWSGLTLCLTKVRSSRARCPATALICFLVTPINQFLIILGRCTLCIQVYLQDEPTCMRIEPV